MRKLLIVVATLLVAGSVTWAAERTTGAGSIKASKIIGQSVEDPSGEKVGTLDELVIDREGRITQAVLSVGGFLGVGEKRIAVSWDNLKFQPEQETIIVNQGKEELTKAPSYEEPQTPRRAE